MRVSSGPAAESDGASERVVMGKRNGGRGTGRGSGENGSGPKTRRRLIAGRVAIWGGVAAIWSALTLLALVAIYAYDLPDVDSLADIDRQPSLVLVAADGTLLASFGDIYGKPVQVADLPPNLPHAVLALEDRRFYEHMGVDFFGLARAMFTNLRAGRIVQGGSTITQQLAKNLFLGPERTLKRKVQELLLALQLERRFTKDQILSLYLNRVYFGAGTYGVDAAARRYFGKPAVAVNLYEAALLAGLLKAPSRYSPSSDAERAHARAAQALNAMIAAGYIDPLSAQEALLERTRGRPVGGPQARYFADWVLSQVQSLAGGELARDVTVVTTLNPFHQGIVEEELARLLAEEGEARNLTQGAVVLLDPSGAVRAMVGGESYDSSQFNRATQALRQPGSAFKTFVYLAALEAGYSPGSRMVDAPIAIDGWQPSNYADKYYGNVTLREAFARSLNSVAVQLSERVGREEVAKTARRLGITAPLRKHPSLPLGTSEVTLLELTGAYAAFANRGQGVWPYGIEEIRDSHGTLLYRRMGEGPGQVVPPEAMGAMTEMMRAVVERGSGKAAASAHPAAGKTGTSQDFRDAWFIGYTAHLVGGVWLGNDDGAPTKGVTGGSLPARLWGAIMKRAHAGLAPQPLPGDSMEVPLASVGDFFASLLDRLTGRGEGVPPETHRGAVPEQAAPQGAAPEPRKRRRVDPTANFEAGNDR
jgi:penicillin-binding protein 1A